MERAHRSPAQWLRDLVRRTKPTAGKSASEQPRSSITRAAESTDAQSTGFGHPQNSTENEGPQDSSVSGRSLSATQTQVPMNKDKELVNEDHRVVTALEQARLVDKIRVDQSTPAAKDAPRAAPPTRPEISQGPTHDDDNPIWTNSIKRFEREKPEEYKLMMRELDQIRTLKDVDTWDTWIGRQDLSKDSEETKYEWLRKCKNYMPSVALVRTIALELSNLDPYKVARPVVAGVFVLIEVGHSAAQTSSC